MRLLSSKYFILLFVLVLVGGGAVAVWGLLLKTDPGPLAVCWDEGVAVIDKGCMSRELLVWDKKQVPLGVAYEGPAKYQVLEYAAITGINEQLGFKMFEPSSEKSAEVEVVWYDDAPTSFARVSKIVFTKDLQGLRAHIFMYPSKNLHVQYMALMHQLGHAMGLADDPMKSSLMYHGDISESYKGNLAGVTQFTSSDVKMIRELYGE